MSANSDDNVQNLDYWQVIRNHWGIILLTLIMSIVTAFVITTLMTRTYSSTTRFIINADGYTVIGPKVTGETQDRNFLGTQIKSLTSAETLKLVDGGENKRRFTKGMGADYVSALKSLAGRISVTGERGSSIVSLTVVDSDKGNARDLANEVRIQYEQRRLADRGESSSKAKTSIDVELKEAEELAEVKEKALAASSKKTGLPYVKKESFEVTGEVADRFRKASSKRTDARSRFRKLKRIVNDVVTLNDANLVPYLESHSELISRPQVTVLAEEIRNLTASKQSAVIEGYGAKHPRILIFTSQLENSKKELTTELKQVRDLIKRDFLTEKKDLDGVEKEYMEAKVEYDVFTEAYNEHSIKIEEYDRARFDLTKLKDTKQKALRESGFFNLPIKLEQEATLPKSPSSPNVPLIMGIGSAAGLVFGLAIAFLLELMDTSVKTMEDVERYLGVAVLAVVPQDVGLLHKQSTSSPDAEAYRILRTNIEFNRKSAEDNAITVVSGGAGEGKSTTIVNLAYICAQGGYTTLLIDGDLRRPRLHSYLDLDNSIGLTNYLTTDTALENVIRKTSTENLFFMPSGILPQDASGILNSRRMTEMLDEVKSRFDLVFVDSPPILGVSDAAVISSEVDHTMIVIQHRKLPRKLLQRVKQAVEAVGGNIIGVVLNNVDVRSDTEYQYYTSYYTYYSPTETRAAAKAAGQDQAKQKSEVANSDDLY